MQAVIETTGGLFPAHTYLLDSNNLVAYIKRGETVPFYFKQPIKGFDRRGRTFEKTDDSLFTQTQQPAGTIEVKGSKGETYTVDTESQTCTCPGYTFRGACKHVKELVSA
jgi:hypothetical protein